MSSQKNKGMPLNTFTRTSYSLPDSVWWGQTQLHAMHSWAARRAHRLVVCQKKILTPVQCTWPEGVPTRKKSSSRKDSIDGRPSTADSSGLSETSTPPTRDSTPAKARVSSDYNQPPMSRRHRHVHISLYVLFTYLCFSDLFVPVPQVKYEEDPHLRLGPEPDAARRQLWVWNFFLISFCRNKYTQSSTRLPRASKSEFQCFINDIRDAAIPSSPIRLCLRYSSHSCTFSSSLTTHSTSSLSAPC